MFTPVGGAIHLTENIVGLLHTWITVVGDLSIKGEGFTGIIALSSYFH